MTGEVAARVKSEPTDGTSSLVDDSLPPPSVLPPQPPAIKPEPVVLEGKRRRKQIWSKEDFQAALEDDADDADVVDLQEEEFDQNKALFKKAEKERLLDDDFKLKNHQRIDYSAIQFHENEVLGKCCHCGEYLRRDQALSHMAEKHPEDVVRRLHCPICGGATYHTLEEHLKVSEDFPCIRITN